MDMLERYRRADAVLDAHVEKLVLNEGVAAHWIGGAAFWYRRQRYDGGEYVLVGADWAPRAAFDHAAVAVAVSGAAGEAVGPWSLDVTEIVPEERIVARVGDRLVTVSLADGAARVEAGPKHDPTWLLSPDGTRALLVHEHDLHLRDFVTGAERRLTTDGEEGHAWGQYPDSGLLGVPRRRSGLPFPPHGWFWSPDGRTLVGGRFDERHVAAYPFLESVPQDGGARPKVYNVRQPLVGEPGPVFSAVAIDAATGARVAIALDPDMRGLVNSIEPLAWTHAGRRFAMPILGADGREARLIEVDLDTGAVRTVIAERPSGYVGFNASLYNQPNVRVVRDGREAIWWSERSGWGHLYRYDMASGALLGAITAGEWLVRDIVHVDKANERLFLTASGLGEDPYHRGVWRVGFDGDDLVNLTPEAGDHALEGAPIPLIARLLGAPLPARAVSPDGSVFIDSVSTVQAPGETMLRSTRDGTVLTVLERADASALLATGWRSPEPFKAKAADGVTDLHGVIYRPRAGQAPVPVPAPVIDALYAGPQVVVTPHNFRASRGEMGSYGRASLAALGFAVVVVDGRGTPLRSKAFHDAGFGDFADVALDDHVAVLRALCARDPSLDGARIGAYGHSFGGYVSARAILRHPDIYKVAVASAGSHNLHGMYDGVRVYLAPPDYGGRVMAKPAPDAVPENYRALDNATLAANLTGKLLLAYGDMDENAYPAVTLQLIDALIHANRSPDLLYLPNRAHGFAREPYFVRRLWDYFVTHLLGARPPADYRIGEAAERPEPA